MSGLPVVRPLWFEFPDNKDTWATEEEMLLGPGMLIKPVIEVGGGGTWQGA